MSVLLNELCERTSAAGVGREFVLSHWQYLMYCAGYREPVINAEAPQDQGKLSVCDPPLLERAKEGGVIISPAPNCGPDLTERRLTQPNNLMPCITAIMNDIKSSQQHLEWFCLFWQSIISNVNTCVFPL